MNYNINHIIQFVKNPDNIYSELSLKRIAVVTGGKHLERGTYNSLSVFNNCYIEWVGIFDYSLAKENRIPHSVIDHIIRNHMKEGVVHLAVSTLNISKSIKRFKKMGLKVYGPVNGKRIQPNGQLITWKQAYLYDSVSDSELPFLIQWESRPKDILSTLNVNSSELNNSTIRSITLCISDLNLVKKWSTIFDWPVIESDSESKVLRAPNMDVLFIKQIKNDNSKQYVSQIDVTGKSFENFHGVQINF